jgi:ammonium transporter, Amt family
MNRRCLLGTAVAATWLLTTGGSAWAADGPPAQATIDGADTAWMLTSSALVLMMTIPGLALFYGGLVRSKNVLSTLMHSLFCAALISVTWVLFGYSLSFSGDGSLWGNLSKWGLGFPMGNGILHTAGPGTHIPQMLFVMYMGTFAIITPALISGSFAERIRFPAFALLMLLWSTFIYTPVCHWIWADSGWLHQLGVLDFAGGTVVHISSGISALVTAIYLGKRFGYGHEPMPPHNLVFTVIGAGLLWFGWFGFNAGSALGSNELASVAFVNTNTAAGMAALAWMFAEWMKTGKPTILGAASGAVAGLATVTQAAGYVTPMAALFIGMVAGIICYSIVSLKPKFGYDDALDVVGVHLVGGTMGALLTGLFAANMGSGPLKYQGGATLLGIQALAVVVTYVFCGGGTLVLLVVINTITRVRADQQEEILGMDLTQHSERAYVVGAGENVAFVHEPRPAMTPPSPRPGRRFTLALAGIDAEAMTSRWRALCQNGTTPHPPEFQTVYSQVSTIRGNRFNFRGGDPAQAKRNLEQLFKPVAGNVSATLEDN